MSYLLDANVFIEAKNLHYGMDFCPAFWDWLLESNAAGTVFSIDKVADELAAVADELSSWAGVLGGGFFLQPDAAVFPGLRTVAEWAQGQGYDPAAVSGFLQVADYYLVAQALVGQHVVVTREVPSSSKKKIKIPDACIGLGVRFMSPYQMLRRERARFVLGDPG